MDCGKDSNSQHRLLRYIKHVRLIETSLKFTQIIRILVLVTPLGCHPISFSCCVIRKNAKTYYHSYVIMIGATDMFCHKNALLLYFLIQVSFHRTIHWSDAKSVTSNCWYGKLNIQSMPITRTLANLNCFCCCCCCCCCCQPFTSYRGSSVLQHSTLSEKAFIWRILI